jgi:predicted SAM-dependent methyltransferase
MPEVMVNIGCGTVYHPEWLNLDVVPASKSVCCLDVRKGLPLSDCEAAACFSSHVIEHLSPATADAFLCEQRRVLKPGGILRVVCPDLAEICGTYLSEYELSKAVGEASFRHRHLIAELVDQMVRSQPGGQLAVLWGNVPLLDREWLAQRMGYVADAAVNCKPAGAASVIRKLVSRAATAHGRRAVTERLRTNTLCAFATLLGGRRFAKGVQEALFRGAGENHLWMWDEVTLGDKLRQLGFEGVRRCELGDSGIPRWSEFELEMRDGVPIKPHSLVMEARKASEPGVCPTTLGVA